MSIDKRLLDVLCCPVSKTALTPLSRAQLAELNRHVAAGTALRVDGAKVAEPLSEGLITTDGKVIYRIDDGVPVLLAEEGIGTTQFQDFPR
jgi:uncharacterized protein YbaR (Trm112 family)